MLLGLILYVPVSTEVYLFSNIYEIHVDSRDYCLLESSKSVHFITKLYFYKYFTKKLQNKILKEYLFVSDEIPKLSEEVFVR